MPKQFKRKDLYELVAEHLNKSNYKPFSAREFKPHNIESYISRVNRGLTNPDLFIEKSIKLITKQLIQNATIKNSAIAKSTEKSV